MTSEKREKLSAQIHEQWANWTKHMLSNLDESHIGNWKKQISTPYSDLSEEDKDKDRREADKIIEIIESEIKLQEIP